MPEKNTHVEIDQQDAPCALTTSQKRMLINANQPDEIRVALTEGLKLVDLDIETPEQEQKKSNIYKGIISSVAPSLGAVFVNYGSERHGFLPLKEISSEYFLTKNTPETNLENIDIRKILKEGQPLVVQVEKEERGSKGAALTTFISLAGSFLVLMPNNPNAGGISRRIEGEERDTLKDTISQLTVPEGMGIIIRTAGVQRTKDELEWDLEILLQYWDAIKQAATMSDKPGPYLIHRESDVVIRSIRDYLRQDIDEIIIDDEAAYARAHHYLSQIRPNLIERLKLYQDPLPLFSRFQIEQQIETAYQRELTLPSGGSIVIDHTEALVAIDINSARATKGSNIEETAFNTNIEAAKEIARQLRIRDIGGLVVIDFIDMTPPRNQRAVEDCLRNALQHDRARIQLGRISRFGLMEMSRQRIGSSLTRLNHMVCPQCEGQGSIRSIESQAVSIIHMVQEEASKMSHANFELQLPLDLATFIMNEKRHLIHEIETHYHVQIMILPNEFMTSPHYQIKQIKQPTDSEHTSDIPSYKVLKSARSEGTPTPKKIGISESEPAVHQFLAHGSSTAHLTQKPGHPIGKKSTSVKKHEDHFIKRLVKRVWIALFNQGEKTATKQTGSTKKPVTQRKISPSPTRRNTAKQTPRQQTRDANNTTPSANRTRRSPRSAQPQQRNGQTTSSRKTALAPVENSAPREISADTTYKENYKENKENHDEQS